MTAMPDCAGFVPWLASVKTSVVVPPSATEAAPKVLAIVGLTRLTTRHWSAELFAARVALTFAARLVNAAGLPAQLALVWVAWFVTPATVTVQLAVPPVIAMPVSPESTRVPAVYAAVAGPEQPAEYATAGVAESNRSPVGSVSPSAMPDCAGLPPPLASVKTRLVVPASAMDAAPKVLATVGCTTASDWLVTPLVSPLAAVICAAPFTAVPREVPRTVSVIVHDCPAFTAMLLAVKGCEPSTAVNAGVPQAAVAEGAAGLAIAMPAGSVSEKLMPVRLAALAAVLSRVKARVVVPPRPTLEAANALARVGSGRTTRVASTPLASTRWAAPMLALVLL